MPRLHLVFGPIGAGKSTRVRALAAEHHAVPLVLDAWMTTLFGADERPATGRMEWYLERRARCLAQLSEVALEVLRAGASVVLEPSLILRAEREALYPRFEAAGFPISLHVVDAPRELRWERVEQRNRSRSGTFSVEVPRAFFDLSSDRWEPLDPAETERRTVHHHSTG